MSLHLSLRTSHQVCGGRSRQVVRGLSPRANYRKFCRNAALIHRDWTEPAQRQLYEEIYINDSLKTFSPFLSGLINGPQLGLYPIRKIFWTQYNRHEYHIEHLLDFLKLYDQQQIFKRLESLHLTFSDSDPREPFVDLKHMLGLITSLVDLSMNGRKVGFVFKDETPINTRLSLLRVENPDAVLSDTHYPFLDALKVLTSRAITAKFHRVENLGGEIATSGLINRLRYLQLHRGKHTVHWTEIVSSCVFPQLEHLRLDISNNSSMYRLDHFDDWEMPALKTFSTLGYTDRVKTMRTIEGWVIRPVFGTVVRWNIPFPVELGSDHPEWIDFMKSCRERDIKVFTVGSQ